LPGPDGGTDGWHGIHFTDLGSSNGSYCDGAETALADDVPTLLRPGATLGVGKTVFRIDLARVGEYDALGRAVLEGDA
jgi:hypothetical protein